MKNKEAVGRKGLDFEKFILKELNIKYKGAFKPTKGSHKWDAYVNGNEPVSIKNSRRNGSNELMFADIFRQSEIEEPFFYLIIGFWGDEEINDKTHLNDLYILKINSEEWMKMFDKKILGGYKKLLEMFEGKYIDENKAPDKWSSFTKKGNELWTERTSNIMRPRPKWGPNDSTRRVQCGINQKVFFEEFLTNDKLIMSKRIGNMAPLRNKYRKFINSKIKVSHVDEDITVKETIYKDRTERETKIKRSTRTIVSEQPSGSSYHQDKRWQEDFDIMMKQSEFLKTGKKWSEWPEWIKGNM